MKNEQTIESYSHPIEVNSVYGDSYTINTNAFGTYTDILSYYNDSEIQNIISYPILRHQEIMKISEAMYNKNGIYGQTVAKMKAAPTLDYVLFPCGEITNPKETKRKIDKIDFLLRHKLNHSMVTRDCIHNELVVGEYVAILRDTKAKRGVPTPSAYVTTDKIEGTATIDNLMLQPLDLEYVRFEGIANGDYVVSFDLSYFDKFSYGLVGEVKNFPTEFIRGYLNYKKDVSKRWLKLDQKKTFACKYRSAMLDAHGRPLGLFALSEMIFSEDYLEAQRFSVKDNTSILTTMTLPQGKEPGSCSLNTDQQKNQYNAFKSAVNARSSGMKSRIGTMKTLKLAPGTQVARLNLSDSMFLSKTLTAENSKNTGMSLGLDVSALGGGENSASYSSLSVNIDLMLAEVYQMLEEISKQYTKIINHYLENTDEDFIEIEYLKTSTLNREESFQIAKDLYTLAGGSRTYLYAVGTGASNTYMKMMDLEKALDYDHKYPPKPTSYTANAEDLLGSEGTTSTEENSQNKTVTTKAQVENKGGRPRASKQKLSDSGQKTRTNGGNQAPKPSSR